MQTLNAVDLFAGSGGWSHGWQMATGRPPMIAVNHCAHAIRLHKINHPATQHFLKDIREVDPAFAVAGRKVDWLHLSPDCTHFSRAKGGKPKQQSIRGLAWLGIDWARVTRSPIVSLENVAEFEDWGPLLPSGQPDPARKGETFREFVAKFRELGYEVEWRVLCAADYGAPTIRKRLFIIARRDGLPIAWPMPTHGGPGQPPWRTAAECIDWDMPVPSIFDRARPLAAATCCRIAHGIMRYVVNEAPFLVPSGRSAAWIAKHYAGVVGSSLNVPLGTISARDSQSLVTATLGNERSERVAAFLTSYYSEGGGTANPLYRPMPTVVTKGRHGLITCHVNGEERHIVDIGMRMLQPRELARAQGFPDSYVLQGTKTEQIARIGNSLCPQWADAIVRANTRR